MTTKDFGPIESDYAFFMAHATEAASDVAEYQRQLAGFAAAEPSIRLLDFGCGNGEFSARLYTALQWPASQLQLTLLEPVAQHRAAAIEQLQPFTQQPIATVTSVAELPAATFDLILANHVLYYVDDLPQTLTALVQSLRPGGRVQLAIASWSNVLLELWQTGFCHLGQPVPYHGAEDVAAILTQQSIPYLSSRASYSLVFPDTTENRRKILRFLFGHYLDQMPTELLLAEFDPFVVEDQIQIHTHSDHMCVVTPG